MNIHLHFFNTLVINLIMAALYWACKYCTAYNACYRYLGTIVGMVTNVTIDFPVTMHTSITNVTNVPTVIFVFMVAKVTTGRRCYINTSAVQTFASFFNTSWLPGLPPIWHRTTFCLRRCLTHVHIMKRRSVICLSAESRRIGGEEVQLHSFLSFELGGAEWSTICTHRFTPRKETGYRLNVRFYGPQSWSGCFGELSYPYRDTNSRALSPWLCLYTDYAFTACNTSTTISTN
jgi:hypothetical protein